MKKVLDWMKSNVVALVCGVLVLVSIGWIYVINGWGDDFIKKLDNRLSRVKTISSYRQQVVQYPSPVVEGGTETKQITINQSVIDKLKNVYVRMDREGKGIFEAAIRINRLQQTPMTSNLFPDNKDTSLRIIARRDYARSFGEMFEGYSASAGLPRLHAKGPIAESDLSEALRSQRDNFVIGNFAGKSEQQLTDQEREKLNDEMQKKRIELIQNYAKGLNIYAQTTPGAAEYPFQIMSWSSAGVPPSDLELWEGQMQLWIQQDIARVIALTNSVSQQDMDVTRSPIKRLLGISVKKGYVGLDNRGVPDGGGGGELKLNPSEEAFNYSMTGRKSNELYDVRHAHVDMIVDIVRFPEFFDNMIQVNFITPLNMEVTDVDEYEDYKRNYYYGLGDCVRVSMDLESIWLRDWTSKLMPEKVKVDLGVPLEAPKTP